MTCTVCNWSSHPASIHGDLCVNGHPLTVVGRYTNGRCRMCQRESSKRYADKHRDRERERSRLWRARRRVIDRAFSVPPVDGHASVCGNGHAARGCDCEMMGVSG